MRRVYKGFDTNIRDFIVPKLKTFDIGKDFHLRKFMDTSVTQVVFLEIQDIIFL